MLTYPWILLMSLAGLILCAYIYSKHKVGEKLVCPIGAKCDLVMESKYSLILGIMRLETLGMFYYGALSVFYGSILFMPYAGAIVFVFPFVKLATAGAALFSLFLIGIQAFVLKQWCSWCLMSAALSFGIFILTFAF